MRSLVKAGGVGGDTQADDLGLLRGVEGGEGRGGGGDQRLDLGGGGAVEVDVAAGGDAAVGGGDGGGASTQRLSPSARVTIHDPRRRRDSPGLRPAGAAARKCRREAAMAGWDFWIDRGGTFTDIVGAGPGGAAAPAEAAVGESGAVRRRGAARIRGFLGLGAEAAIPAARVASVKMGTTVATNALLERKGEPVVLVTTRGLGQQLRLGYQNRPRLFDRQIVLPEMLYARVIEARERVRADGTVEVALDEAQLARR